MQSVAGQNRTVQMSWRRRAAWLAVLCGAISCGARGAHAFTAADADTLLAAHTKAFYHEQGDQAWFTKSTDGGKTDFWMWAEQMEMTLDAYERTHNPQQLTMFNHLFHGFVAAHGANWARNPFNDDIMWMVIACARANLLTGNAEYRDAAKANFDLCYARAASVDLGGGLWWKTDNKSKNACVNGPGAIAAFLLGRVTGDDAYVTKAKSLFLWEKATLFDAATGRVADNIDSNGKVARFALTYNQGTFVGAANFLGDTDAAHLAALYTMNQLCHDGYLPASGEGGDGGGFNGIGVRWIARFMKDHNEQATFEPWLQKNAEAAWQARRTADNLSWCRWPQPTPEGRRYSWDCSNAVVITQLVRPTEGAKLTTLGLAQTAATAPCMAVLDRFTAPDVPAMGPGETESPVGNWVNAVTPPNLPGNGLAQHPMLYVGENYDKMFLVNNGKVIWTYSTGKSYEYDDVWMLSNGNILFSRMEYVEEITPDKKVVWRYNCNKAPGVNHTEIHTCQPIGLDKVMFVLNGLPPKLMIVNIKTGAVEVSHELPFSQPPNPNGIHGEYRRTRVTAQGTYLVPIFGMGDVVEYDKDFKEIWRYKIKSPWAAIRLKNGNTLITDEAEHLTREVNTKGETVWEFNTDELPVAYRFASAPQSCTRLANGNTIFTSRGGGGKGPQLIEVTPDKKVVWVLQDWKDLADATAVQILDDPGIPENPGESEH